MYSLDVGPHFLKIHLTLLLIGNDLLRFHFDILAEIIMVHFHLKHFLALFLQLFDGRLVRIVLRLQPDDAKLILLDIVSHPRQRLIQLRIHFIEHIAY